MAELHEALKALSPTDWNEVPVDNLSSYLSQSFTACELICNTVPQPPNGEAFESCRPHLTTPNVAKSSEEMHASAVRSYPPHKDHENLQSAWGKPVKVAQKQNPFNVAVFKMAGHDRHGAWFARRSVHEGIGFKKFHKAMMHEFPHSLSVEGGPGVGAVRGLAGDQRIESRDVEGVGKLEVYQLSAQFPGPVTPRDFMTLLMTTDDALSEKSGLETQDGSTHVPRHFMIVSRPIKHPNAPERAGYVRGQYESVELIREIPLNRSSSKSPSDPASDNNDPELNPVEWIMITRSDPGGGIPRFLVDRGTPEAMLADISKFLNWACAIDDTISREDAVGEQGGKAPSGTEAVSNGQPIQHEKEVQTVPATLPDSSSATPQQSGGMLSGITQTLGAGIDAYAPTAVSQQVHSYLDRDDPEPLNDKDLDESDTSSVASSDSFMSAEEMRRLSTAPDQLLNGASRPVGSASQENLSIRSGESQMSDKKNLNHHEKEVQKLIQQREKLDRKLAKKREDEENRLKKMQEKDQTEQEKAKEKLEKDMKKTEDKHRKEMEKLEAKREKEERKGEQRRRKKEEQNKLSLVTRERNEFRSQLDLHKRENALFAERMEELQRENTLLASKLGGLAGGKDLLQGVRDEMSQTGRKRTMSMKSDERKSMESSSSKKTT